MSKYFYGYVVLLFSVVLYASSQKAPASIEINKIVNEEISFLNDLERISQASREKFGGNIYNGQSLAPAKKENNEHLFYFYSESMEFDTLRKLLPQFKRYKDIKPESTIFIIFNGFPTKGFMRQLRKEYSDELKGLFKLKIHPPMYKYFNLEQVPAFALSMCPADFRFKKCTLEQTILARGDLSVVDFFNLLSTHDEKYLDVYHEMIEAK